LALPFGKNPKNLREFSDENKQNKLKTQVKQGNTLMIIWLKKIAVFCLCFYYCYGQENITPYKYLDKLPEYRIPEDARRCISRENGPSEPDIAYYFSRPDKETFPIAILCEGSSDESHVASVIHFHRYFLQECMDLNLAVLTIEQWGVDGNEVNKSEWINHYTRTQRLKDHKRVINDLLDHPPQGWNGKFVFIGVSEGGPIVTALSAEYSEHTIATINWSGAGDWSWREELWVFLKQLVQMNPECPHDKKLSDCQTCFELISVRKNYDALMDATIFNPVSSECFLNMTYLYHADALTFPKIEYSRLTKPFLVVSGALDTIIDSSDLFVEKAQSSGAPVTYYRISDMDHFVRKRPDILQASFDWLAKELQKED
jgi:pimeloyl-ACP methyl ester carboxylesterase